MKESKRNKANLLLFFHCLYPFLFYFFPFFSNGNINSIEKFLMFFQYIIYETLLYPFLCVCIFIWKLLLRVFPSTSFNGKKWKVYLIKIIKRKIIRCTLFPIAFFVVFSFVQLLSFQFPLQLRLLKVGFSFVKFE